MCYRFLSTTMPSLNPMLCKRTLNEEVVAGNVTPITLVFCEPSDAGASGLS